MITGLLKYEDKNCVFKLKSFTLEIEEIENRDKIFIDDIDYLFNPDNSKNSNVPNLLIGNDFDNGKEIHFNVTDIIKTGAKTHSASLYSYIIFEQEETSYDGIQIHADELNWFHNIKQSYSFMHSPDTGQSELKMESFENTEKQFEFNIEGQTIQGSLNISRTYSHVSTMPIKLQTELNLYFKPTNEFELVERLANVTYSFLKFITYRKNINFKHLILKKKNEEGKYRKVGRLYIKDLQSHHTEEKKVLQERLIDFPLLEEHLGQLFEKLAENDIYITHIPETSLDQNIITPSRVIMITAGFEWQFRFTYKELSRVSEDKYKDQRQEILAFLEEKIEENTGKKKKYFKSYRNLLLRSNMTLSDKINWALNEFSNELNLFIRQLYNLNGVTEVKYSDISARIQTQRNNIAHGNIDEEFDSYVIMDLIVLEWLYYAMVLSDVGISRANVRSAINKLFNRRFAL
ncbi:HEPN domain-containing protein [Pseudogracilibacillus auburnensis]|uniref:ApeA N-terminal domain-containing protein n=1 Tax=Pseudogracilibacillus auburnensis TaxID=1494959 RepID=A0A2V3WGJ6_9BACI|nr:HEPN domain-containing protein [Pseudogracilibacillus auburnensis]PXW87939.1 hypothetical protein DFR56_10489 [Pseudogracilibacillus auburnensis]